MLPFATRFRSFKELATQLFDVDQYVCESYREIAPGLWFPAQQRFERQAMEAQGLTGCYGHELKLVEARVDEPLADGLFKVEFREGASVTDHRYDPPLVYLHKSDRTQDEWAEIHARHTKR